MDSFKASLQDTVDQIKRANEDAADLQMKEIKKLKHCKPHKFKRKANEDKHKFNMKLGHSSTPSPPRRGHNLKKLDLNWKKVRTYLLERQKHILLADKSESGWFYRRRIQEA